MNDTLFYLLGAGLAVMAVLTSFVGIRVSRFPSTAGVMAATIAIFAVLVSATMTFGVLNAQDEQESRAQELEAAGERVEEEQESPVGGEEAVKGGEAADGRQASAVSKGGGTLKLAADPTAVAFDATKLSSKPGRVTIEFSNPAPIEHDVAIEQDGKVIATSKRITEGETSVSAELEPGTYSFLCTVPGHAEAGMEGTLVVK